MLGTRAMVLETAGFRVLTSVNLADAESLIRSGEIAFMVLCHSLATKDCEAVIEFANGLSRPIKILILTAAAESKCAQHSDEARLSTLDGPRKLVETVRKLFC